MRARHGQRLELGDLRLERGSSGGSEGEDGRVEGRVGGRG